MSQHTVSRRTFLAAAAAAWPLAAAAERAQQRTIPVGLELYSVREALASDLLGTVTTVAKMGYTTVEFYSPYTKWTTETAKDVRRRLDDLGISCLSTHNPASAFRDGLTRAIELNQIIGSRSIVMASPPRIADADGWKALADECTRVTETLRPLGMRAGYHNHAAEWRDIGGGQRAMDILAAGTPQDFTLQLDIGTCVEMGADPVAWINANPGRIRSMHCKDWSATRGFAIAFGEGDAPWLRIFEAAEATGGIEYYLIEQEVPGPDGEFAMAQRCLDNYRKLRS